MERQDAWRDCSTSSALWDRVVAKREPSRTFSRGFQKSSDGDVREDEGHVVLFSPVAPGTDRAMDAAPGRRGVFRSVKEGRGRAS